MEVLTEAKWMNLTKTKLLKGYLAYKRTINVEINVCCKFILIPLIINNINLNYASATEMESRVW
jgi:hypothetical protein